jgi:hypothetical protein
MLAPPRFSPTEPAGARREQAGAFLATTAALASRHAIGFLARQPQDNSILVSAL